MSINTAIELLLEIEQKRGQAAYDDQTTCVGIARLGADDQQIIAGSMQQLKDVDFGPPLHCLIIAGNVHVVEEEILSYYRLGSSQETLQHKQDVSS
eukprot:jgi/Chrzof1/4591/Cz14g19130.t1